MPKVSPNRFAGAPAAAEQAHTGPLPRFGKMIKPVAADTLVCDFGNIYIDNNIVFC